MLNYYKVGGSLQFNHPSYVIRQADHDLYYHLKAGEYCLILNSRQMGKSSLRVRVSHQLRQEGTYCAFIDLTVIGSQETQAKWYYSFASELIDSLELEDEIDLSLFWQQTEQLTEIQQLKQLLTLILKTLSRNLVIFIDEIDSLLKISFKDDFLTFIRACYNQRVEQSEYQQLTFCLLGVASPAALIKDKEKTPFNIGKSINLTGITFEEAKESLLEGLSHFNYSEKLLQEILQWTGGQPFLTQKVCYLVTTHTQDQNPNLAEIIQKYILSNWESQDNPVHLKTIRNRLLANEQKTIKLLSLYQQVLQGSAIADNSEDQIILTLTGVAVKRNSYLQVYNPIYQRIFNSDWILDQLNNIRPYTRELNLWLNHDQDSRYLLQGQRLTTALIWSKERSLSDIDYQFLSASQAQQDRQVNQILAEANQKAKRLIRLGGLILGITSMISILIAIFTFIYHQKQFNEIKEVTRIDKAGTQALAKFKDSQLNGLISAIEATQDLNKLVSSQKSLADYPTITPLSSLINILATIREQNELIGHEKGVISVDISRDNQRILTGSKDGTVKLWSVEGQLLDTFSISNNKSPVSRVNFSANGRWIMASNQEGILKIWTVEGEEISELNHDEPIYSFALSPDEKIIVTTGYDGIIKQWKLDGKPLNLIKHNYSIYSLVFDSNNQQIITGDNQGMIHFWSMKGEKLKTIKGHSDTVYSLALDTHGQQFVSGSADKTAKLWTIRGESLITLEGHQEVVNSVIFNPDNRMIISGSSDKTIKLWTIKGQLVETLKGHKGSIKQLTLSPNGSYLASASEDATVKLWQLSLYNNSYFISKEEEPIIYLNFDADDNQIIAGNINGLVKAWSLKSSHFQEWINQNSLIPIPSIEVSLKPKMIILGDANGQIILSNSQGITRSFKGHQGEIKRLNLSRDQQFILSGDDQGIIKIWRKNGTPIKTLNAHQDQIDFLRWYPNDQEFVSISQEGTMKFWTKQGKLIKMIQDERLKNIIAISFSQNHQIVSIAHHSGLITFWNEQGWLGELPLNTLNNIGDIKISSDGKIMAIGYNNGQIELWKNYPNPRFLLTLASFNTPITSLRFSEDSKKLIAGYENGSVQFWNLDLNDNLKQGCNWLKNYHAVSQKVKVCDSIKIW